MLSKHCEMGAWRDGLEVHIAQTVLIEDPDQFLASIRWPTIIITSVLRDPNTPPPPTPTHTIHINT